jgi:hypothetical protein
MNQDGGRASEGLQEADNSGARFLWPYMPSYP